MKVVEGETFQLGAKPIAPHVFFHFIPFSITFKYGLQIHLGNVVSKIARHMEVQVLHAHMPNNHQ